MLSTTDASLVHHDRCQSSKQPAQPFYISFHKLNYDETQGFLASLPVNYHCLGRNMTERD